MYPLTSCHLSYRLPLDDLPTLADIHQETVQKRHKHVRHVRHHQHLRLGQTRLDVVEVQNPVVGDKTHSHHRVHFWVLSGN